jgi:hypothetical protein
LSSISYNVVLLLQLGAMKLPEIALTDSERAFALEYVQTSSVPAAALKAGIGEKAAYGLLHRPRVVAAILVETRRQLALAAPMGLRVLKTLAETAADEKVKRDCATRILDRAGMVAPRATAADDPGQKQLHEMTIDELHKLAAQLENVLAERAKPVPFARVDRAGSAYPIDLSDEMQP